MLGACAAVVGWRPAWGLSLCLGQAGGVWKQGGPQACWEPPGPGGRSLGISTGPTVVSLQAGRPAGPHYPPCSPLKLGRGGRPG